MTFNRPTRSAKGVRDRLEDDVRALTAYPERVVGSEGHAAARAWLVERFTALRLTPFHADSYALPYHDGFANLAGVIPAAEPASSASKPIVIGAHYDTVPGSPGADDNSASLAIIAEVAARLMHRPAAPPVITVAFDAEEPPYFQTRTMGSIRFVEDHVQSGVHAAFILDLVAHEVPLTGLEQLVAFMGAESHAGWTDLLRPVAAAYGPVMTVPNALLPDMSDHHAFRLANHPYLFITAGQGRNYHKPTDTLENADLGKAVRVADMLEQLVRTAADTTWNGAEEHDSSELDHELMQQALGPENLAELGVHSPDDVEGGLKRLVARHTSE